MIPHYVVLTALTIGALLATIFAWFAILFIGRYPRSLFDFIEDVIRWHNGRHRHLQPFHLEATTGIEPV